MPPENKNPNQEPNNDLANDISKILDEKPAQKPIAPPQKPIAPTLKEGDGNTPADQLQINTLRTYKSDINQTVQSDKITTAKILMAEQKRRDKEEKIVDKNSIKGTKNKFVLLLGVLLGLAAVIVIIFTVKNMIVGIGRSNIPNLSKTAPDLFFVNKTEYLDITNKPQLSILESVDNLLKKEYAEDFIIDIALFRVVEGETSKKITSGSLMSLLQFNAPNIFTRSLSVEHIFGVYRLQGINHPFLFIQLSDFENAFDSVFEYENNIAYDFRKIFNKFPDFNKLDALRVERQKFLDIRDAELKNATTTEVATVEIKTSNEETATSTATSTEAVPTIDNYNQQIRDLEVATSKYRSFIDLIIQNVDTRSNVTQDGQILMYYAFIEDKYLLIADDVEVLREINRRLREVNIVR